MGRAQREGCFGRVRGHLSLEQSPNLNKPQACPDKLFHPLVIFPVRQIDQLVASMLS